MSYDLLYVRNKFLPLKQSPAYFLLWF